MKTYVCVQRCWQRNWGGKGFRRYTEGAEYTFPDSAEVPASLFDLIEQTKSAIPDELPKGDDRPEQEGDDHPVRVLTGLGAGHERGLNKHGIYTVGQLRSALMDRSVVETLLNSEHVRLGEATIAQFKKLCGIDEKGNK